MQKVEAYRTTDNELFLEENEAKKHQMSVDKKDEIEEFANSEFCPYKEKVSAGICKKSIIYWETYLKEKRNERISKT